MQEHIIVETVKSVWPRTIQGVMVFGSRARGDERADSDIDLAVLLTEPADPLTVWENAQLLASQLQQDVDLIDLRSATTVLQKEVISSGIWLHKADAFACDLFEVHVISLYQQLQYDRQGILDDIAARIEHG